MNLRPSIHVVDDDPSFRTALSRVLKSSGYEVKAYASAGEFLLDPPSEGESGCILLDLHMPGPSGLDLQEALRRRSGSLPVIFLTGQGDIPQSVRAMRQGAVNFLTKPVPRNELLAAIEEALGRQRDGAADERRRQDAAACYAKLSPREREVFDLVVVGRLNKQIAAEMKTSERTVKAHRARVMEKMQAGSVAELVHADVLLRQQADATTPPAKPRPPNPTG
jgi:RNA polymerase sigma factor (sigma-70 family)